MSTLFLLTSAILFHIPLAFYKDTARRFQRMQQFNQDKAMSYKLENNIPLEYGILSANGLSKEQNPFSNQLFFYISGITSLLVALIPLYFAFDFHWAIIIVGNVIASYFIIPFLVFFIYPKAGIMSIRLLKMRAIMYIIFGVIFFIAGLF